MSRGRDHGLAKYAKIKKFCKAEYPQLYDTDWPGMQPHWDEMVKKFYGGRAWDVDLYLGVLSELPAKESELGPTNTCIILHQFKQLKLGDKFWYENDVFFQNQEKLNAVKDEFEIINYYYY